MKGTYMENKIERKRRISPCNKNASIQVRDVLEYLFQIQGKQIITGQHTQTREQEELKYIYEVTGKLPALCGFELLSYSPNINYDTCDEDCLREIRENEGTLRLAMEWAEKRKGLITFTWHWFSPLFNRNKGFYTKNSMFDASMAIIEGSNEYKAFLHDMDCMAEHLKVFQEKKIPILWRPFHESEGDWFWWSAKGPQVAKTLYRMMFDRYTNFHELDNLIWVWNSPLAAGYVGDDVVDVISRDLYPPAHQHTDLAKEYEELRQITKADKVVAIGEIGTLPSIPDLIEHQIPWSYYMTWSLEYGGSDKWTSKQELKRAYDLKDVITLDNLPRLY